ncbi:MAG: hypothetical protein U0S49_06645 [Rhodospirillales bacterium]|nr:hypothetical protein [Rhodospirillales bacterium]
MSGKRVLWRERCDERVRERRRRQGRVMAALMQAEADAEAATRDETAVACDFDIFSWLMRGPTGEGPPAGEPPTPDP